jgi:uncharacterized protein YPO0396
MPATPPSMVQPPKLSIPECIEKQMSKIVAKIYHEAMQELSDNLTRSFDQLYSQYQLLDDLDLRIDINEDQYKKLRFRYLSIIELKRKQYHRQSAEFLREPNYPKYLYEVNDIEELERRDIMSLRISMNC